jgi:hypothetical protein
MAGMLTALRSRIGSNQVRTVASAVAALMLALSLGLAACGGESAPQRSNFDAVIAPERCGNAGACG